MKLRHLALVVPFALTTLAAHAQGGLYLNPIATRVSNSVADTGYFAFLGPGNTSAYFEGITLGGFYDFAHYSKAGIGLDIHDSLLHSNSATLNGFFVGLRVAPRLANPKLAPFLQANVGAGTTKAPTSLIHVTKAEYGASGGIDYNFSRHVGFRVIEVGYDQLTTISSAIVGGTTTIPSSKLLTVSAGLIFRLPAPKQKEAVQTH